MILCVVKVVNKKMNGFPKSLQGEFEWEIIDMYRKHIVIIENMCNLYWLFGKEIELLKEKCKLCPLETYRLFIKDKEGIVVNAISFFVPLSYKGEDIYH